MMKTLKTGAELRKGHIVHLDGHKRLILRLNDIPKDARPRPDVDRLAYCFDGGSFLISRDGIYEVEW